MSPGGKGGWCVGLRTLSPSYDNCLEILGASSSWNPQGLYMDCFTYYLDLGPTYSHLRHKCVSHRTEIVNIFTTNYDISVISFMGSGSFTWAIYAQYDKQESQS